MVSSKTLIKLNLLFEEFKTSPSLDIYNYSGDLMDAIFEINTLESYFSGIATKLIDGKSITKDESDCIHQNIFDTDGKSLLSVTVERPPMDIEGSQEILLYAKKLDELRVLLISCLR